MKKFKIKKNTGMTYVELIVVLGIFSVLSSVVIFNYGDFQAKVDIKNLASDIALKVVEAQKSSLNGILPFAGYDPDTWKPSYGVYFDINTQKQFTYFADLNNAGGYDIGEGLDTINITKNNYISQIDSYSGSVPTAIINPLSIIFKRPDSSAIFISNGLSSSFDYLQITVASPKGATALIKIYPSGRVQIGGSSIDTPQVPPTCTSWTYTDWGACQSNNTRTRTVLTSSPEGCTEGSPILAESCTYVPACVPTAGSPTPTPTIDEDCNGNMDNAVGYGCNYGCTNPGVAFHLDFYAYNSNCSGGVTSTYDGCHHNEYSFPLGCSRDWWHLNEDSNMYVTDASCCSYGFTSTCYTYY